MKKILGSVLLCAAVGLLVCSCVSGKIKPGKSWKSETVVHKGFKDLGNYVIELPDFTDAQKAKEGLDLVNYRYDHGDISVIGCTAMITRNMKGEVIVGRNMDVEISQDSAYVYKTTYGKYKTANVTYAPGVFYSYEEIKKIDELDENKLKLLPFLSTDCLNEKGLYIEANMRTANKTLSNYGLHSTHGQTTRADGTPWSELRACTSALVTLVGQNCATVAEALEFINNSYDWYTVGLPIRPHYDGWNYCFIIGDATGEYGLIEIAQDEVSYIPYQYGQSNYYITPKWGLSDICGSGHGRLKLVSEIISGTKTLDEAMDKMKAVMWRNETLWIGESHRTPAEVNKNPYNQIVFQDDKGNKQLDWRSDYVQLWPVLDDGTLVVEKSIYQNAKKSTYDPMIAKYFDDAIATGKLIVDDGVARYTANGQKLSLLDLKEKYEIYESLGSDPEKQKSYKPYYDAYFALLNNQTVAWCQNDKNFEALKACAYENIHTKYDADGNYDPSSMSKYEKLKAYYGYGTEKNEELLRDDGSIWTTSLNVGVNCAKKQMKIRFWENNDVVYSFQF